MFTARYELNILCNRLISVFKWLVFYMKPQLVSNFILILNSNFSVSFIFINKRILSSCLMLIVKRMISSVFLFIAKWPSDYLFTFKRKFSCSFTLTVQLKLSQRWLIFTLRAPDVPGLNVGPMTGYAETVSWFSEVPTCRYFKLCHDRFLRCLLQLIIHKLSRHWKLYNLNYWKR